MDPGATLLRALSLLVFIVVTTDIIIMIIMITSIRIFVVLSLLV